MPDSTPTVLFDGVCNLCNASVRFIIDRDPAERFRFASLQSDAGRALLREHQLSGDLSTMVLIENGRSHVRSGAALRVCRRLKGAWPMLYAFILVPPFIRDPLYRLVARNRYRWFGHSESCPIPDDTLAHRFLDHEESGTDSPDLMPIDHLPESR